jgi:putative FmdB family regulatory protein
VATYEYICLGCEQPFEQRRPMSAAVETALACPACGSDRVRRRFSVFSAGSTSTTGFGGAEPSGGRCCGGGGCVCGH